MNDNENFDVKHLISLVWKKKLTLLFFILSFTILTGIYSLKIPNKYTSSVLMIAVEDSQESNLSDYSGLANLAGISLPSDSNKADIGIEVLKSRLFIQNFISQNNILPELMASRGWEITTGKILYDEKIYDQSKNVWTRKVKFPKKSQPSLNEAYDFWKKNIFSVIIDKQTGFIKFEITHYSPVIAQNWAALLISELNNFMREKDVQEAERSINYLNEESNKTNIEELRSLFYKLIQNNIEKKMLAYSRSEYLFQIIDPPIISEEKSSPKRFLLTVLGGLLGLFFGLISILVNHYLKLLTD